MAFMGSIIGSGPIIFQYRFSIFQYAKAMHDVSLRPDVSDVRGFYGNESNPLFSCGLRAPKFHSSGAGFFCFTAFTYSSY